MRSSRVTVPVCVVALLAALQVSVSPQFAAADKIDGALREAFTRQGEVSYVVYMKEQADLSGAPAIQDRDARGWFTYRALKATADRTQASVKARLAAEQQAGRTKRFKSFFSVSAIGVTSEGSVL